MKLYLCRSVGETVWYAVVFTSSPLRPHAAATFIFKFAFSARVFHRTNTFSAQMCLVAIFFFARTLTELRKNPLKSAFEKATAYLLYIKKGCYLRKSVCSICLGPDPDRSQPIFDLGSSGERWQINMGDAFG